MIRTTYTLDYIVFSLLLFLLHQNTKQLWHIACEKMVELREGCGDLTRRTPCDQVLVLCPLLGLTNLGGKFATNHQWSAKNYFKTMVYASYKLQNRTNLYLCVPILVTIVSCCNASTITVGIVDVFHVVGATTWITRNHGLKIN